MRSALYTGVVMHERLRPRLHRLQYRVFCVLLDLDELPALKLPLLGINRPGLFSFQERDHGDGVTPLRQWVTERLADAGIADDGGRVEVLCYPRILGFVFNPLTVFYCHDRDGRLVGVLYEVANTHGERHTYAMPAGNDRVVRHSAPKQFFVSPFIPMDCVYRFRLAPPGPRVGVSILEDDAEGLLLRASFTGRREALTNGALMRMFVGYPLMTLKVVAGIHWEALKLVLKGFRIHDHSPAARRIDSSAPLREAAREPAE
jgi:DUF1365 family protein